MNFSDNGSDVYERFEKYASKSEDELARELAEAVRRMKADGTFDVQALENFFNTAAPFLNEWQKKRMRAIIDALK